MVVLLRRRPVGPLSIPLLQKRVPSPTIQCKVPQHRGIPHSPPQICVSLLENKPTPRALVAAQCALGRPPRVGPHAARGVLIASPSGVGTRATATSDAGCEDSPSGESSRFKSSLETAEQQGGVRLGEGVGPGSKGLATRSRTEYPSRVRLGRGGETSPAAQKGPVHPSSLLLGGGTCCQDLDGRPGTEYPLRQPLTQPPSAFDPSLLALRGGRQLQALIASRVRLERPCI